MEMDPQKIIDNIDAGVADGLKAARAKINYGGPAFPFYFPGGMTAPEAWSGMSLLDYFAGQAPPMPMALMSFALEHADVDNPDKTHGEKCDCLLSIIAAWNFRFARAMIAEREVDRG